MTDEQGVGDITEASFRRKLEMRLMAMYAQLRDVLDAFFGYGQRGYFYIGVLVFGVGILLLAYGNAETPTLGVLVVVLGLVVFAVGAFGDPAIVILAYDPIRGLIRNNFERDRRTMIDAIWDAIQADGGYPRKLKPEFEALFKRLTPIGHAFWNRTYRLEMVNVFQRKYLFFGPVKYKDRWWRKPKYFEVSETSINGLRIIVLESKHIITFRVQRLERLWN